MFWAANRQATRVEEEAYSLLGIFGLSMPTLYGIGREAFQSLQEKLLLKNDQSIFAWSMLRVSGALRDSKNGSGLLAPEPSCFADCDKVVSRRPDLRNISLLGDGIELEVPSIPYAYGVYLCCLECSTTGPGGTQAILLRTTVVPGQHARITMGDKDVLSRSFMAVRSAGYQKRKFHVYNSGHDPADNIFPGFLIRSIRLPRYEGANFDVMRVLSRSGEVVEIGNAPTLVKLPEHTCGPVAVIQPPNGCFKPDEKRVSSLLLAFDFDFNPCLLLSLSGAVEWLRLVDECVKSPPFAKKYSYRKLWNSLWLKEGFETGPNHQKASPRHRTPIPKLDIILDFYLEQPSPATLPEASAYRNIWTVSIIPMPKYFEAIEKHERTQNQRKGYGLMAAGTLTAVLALYYDDRHQKKKKRTRKSAASTNDSDSETSM